MKHFFRSKDTKAIFNYSEAFIGRPEFELITEEEAFPERFAPVSLSKRKQQIDLGVPEEVAVPPPPVAEELKAQKGRVFSDSPGLIKKVVEPKAVGVPTVSGLKGEV